MQLPARAGHAPQVHRRRTLLGAMVAVEFHDGDHARPAPEIAGGDRREGSGGLLLSRGSYGNVLRLMVLLTIEQAVLDEGSRSPSPR